MNQTQFRMLTAAEQTLVVSTEGRRLDDLDEDALLELHDRVRRARNKYSKLYRRQAGAQVKADAARGKASAKNANTAAKAEIFEDALARVSRRLATVARQSAAALKAERLAAATQSSPRASRTAPTPASRARRTRATSSAATGRRGDAALRSPASKRTSAQQKASTKRTEAKRAAR